MTTQLSQEQFDALLQLMNAVVEDKIARSISVAFKSIVPSDLANWTIAATEATYYGAHKRAWMLLVSPKEPADGE